jgi:hypothetical protein
MLVRNPTRARDKPEWNENTKLFHSSTLFFFSFFCFSLIPTDSHNFLNALPTGRRGGGKEHGEAGSTPSVHLESGIWIWIGNWNRKPEAIITEFYDTSGSCYEQR